MRQEWTHIPFLGSNRDISSNSPKSLLSSTECWDYRCVCPHAWLILSPDNCCQLWQHIWSSRTQEATVEGLHGFAASLVHTVSTNQLHSETTTHKEEKFLPLKLQGYSFFGLVLGVKLNVSCMLKVGALPLSCTPSQLVCTFSYHLVRIYTLYLSSVSFLVDCKIYRDKDVIWFCPKKHTTQNYVGRNVFLHILLLHLANCPEVTFTQCTV